MNLLRFLTATVVVLGASVVAHADDLSTGAISGRKAATISVCYVFNASNRPLNIQSIKILQQFGGGTPLTSSSKDCSKKFNNILPPGEMCGLGALLSAWSGYSCIISVNDGIDKVRGTFEFRDYAGNIFNSSELR